jgi:hypothetical protein
MSDTIKFLRSYRINGIAMFDVIASIIGMVLIADYIGISKITAAMLAIPIGIIVHAALGINTTLNYKLNISDMPEE